MDGGDEKFSLTNFAAGQPPVQDESTIINRMMLRFRPIAPKPAAGIDSTRSRPLPKVRTKRKYVRVTSGTRRKKKDNNMKKLADDNRKRFSDEEAATSDRTLQLLPETSSEAGGRRRSEDTALESTVTENNNNNNNNSEEEGGGDKRAAEVETWVTAEEGVVEECMEVVKEEELDEDTCPVFVSDGEGKVVWVNEAYREMVVDQGRGGVSKVRVVLVVAEKLRPCLERCLPFNCWVVDW
ncbi:hypothetical protein LINPERHAP1_LOCUS28107 [Linum perenne]